MNEDNDLAIFEAGISEPNEMESLRDIIGDIFTECGNAVTATFLDDIKNMGYRQAFRGGLSFNLGDVLIPPQKEALP